MAARRTRTNVVAKLLAAAVFIFYLHTTALSIGTQLPDDRLQAYIHRINHTHYEEVHSQHVLHTEWLSWKKRHGRRYPNGKRELERFAVWKSNKVYIDYHNAFEETFGYRLAMNQFGDVVSCVLVCVCVCACVCVWGGGGGGECGGI